MVALAAGCSNYSSLRGVFSEAEITPPSIPCQHALRFGSVMREGSVGWCYCQPHVMISNSKLTVNKVILRTGFFSGV